MPVNITNPEYFKAQEEYSKAKTPEAKITALEKMIQTMPKHKGTDHLLAELRGKIAKHKREVEIAAKKRGGRRTGVKKEGDAQVCLVGVTNSGKSTLLNMLTGSNAKIADFMYTTKKPEVGVLNHGGALIQLVEIPSTFEPEFLSIIHGCDAVLLVVDGTKSHAEQTHKISKFISNKPLAEVVMKSKNSNIEETKRNIWSTLQLIRVYTKGHEGERAVVLNKGQNIEDFTRKIHKDFLKTFRFARIWGPSAKFPGEQVGIAHVLRDGDVVEIFA